MLRSISSLGRGVLLGRLLRAAVRGSSATLSAYSRVGRRGRTWRDAGRLPSRTCLEQSALASFRTLCSLFALSVVLTLALVSSAFAQLLPTLSIDDVTVTEGDLGTTNATFTVTRSGDKTLITTVNFVTANDTATQPGDYAPSSGTLTFNSGEATKTVTVSVNGDTLDEADERFFVNLSTVVNATSSDDRGIGTITDDDDTPQANEDGSPANPITLTEDDPNGVTTNVLANDTGLRDTPIEVEVTTQPSKGTATVNPDNTITYKPSANENGSGIKDLAGNALAVSKSWQFSVK